MGRKIPGKKHRSIVDPEKQRAKRDESLKNKINNPPQNPDEQEVPRSMLNIIELKKQAKGRYGRMNIKNKVRRKRRKKMPLSVKQFLDKEEIQPGMKKPEKFIPNLVQRPDESLENFYHRVNSMTQKIIKETQFEDKFDVTIRKDAETGKILKVDKNVKKKSKHMKGSAKKTLSQKRKEKINKKKDKDSEKDFSQLKDIVEFGEVIHRPPSHLNCGKKLNSPTPAVKKDKYKDLLLQGLLQRSNKQQQQRG